MTLDIRILELVSPGEVLNSQTEHEEEIGHDDEKAFNEEDAALDDLNDGDDIASEVFSIGLEQRMMTGTILDPDRWRSKWRNHL